MIINSLTMSLSIIPYIILLLSLSTTPSFSQSFFYNTFNSTNLTLNGVAHITETGILKLTNATTRHIGHGFYPNQIYFKNQSSFSTAFVFSIVPKYQKLGGHGFAFTISPTKDFYGSQPSQYLGLFNVTNNGNKSNHVFAVEFDTVLNLELEDIDDNHIGVNLNRMTSLNSTRAGFFVDGDIIKHDVCLHSGEKIQAWIDYDGDKQQLDVTLSLSSKKPSSPILSIPVDLKPVFQDFMYVGFSASTGLLSSSHYIFGWSFNMTGNAKSLDLDQLPTLTRVTKSKKGFAIKLSVCMFIAFCMVLVGVGFYVKKRFKNIDVIKDWELDVGPHTFSYKQLKAATKGFHEKQLLGFGGSGKVYKGVLPNLSSEIAVKQISSESNQAPKEFLSEISTLGRLRHRNLVQLLGWSRNKGEFLLIYEFMANGSLDNFIYKNPKMILSWEQRFKIINDIANGLLYLHQGWEQTVLHRDIKAANVLLDSNLNGRLGDFGLAKLYEHGSNPTTTKVVGTLGYLAPELTRTGKPTTNSDVYAFGALLLEVVCGRRPNEPQAPLEELILVAWVLDKCREGKLLEVVDSRLNSEFNKVEVTMVLKLGLMCSSDDPSLRPSMRQVIMYLEGKLPLSKGKSAVEFDDCAPSAEKVKTWSAGYGEGDIVDHEAGYVGSLPLLVSGKNANG